MVDVQGVKPMEQIRRVPRWPCQILRQKDGYSGPIPRPPFVLPQYRSRVHPGFRSILADRVPSSGSTKIRENTPLGIHSCNIKGRKFWYILKTTKLIRIETKETE